MRRPAVQHGEIVRDGARGPASGDIDLSLSASDAAIRTQSGCDITVGAVEVECLRIEATAAPGQGPTVLGVSRIGNDLEEVRVTRRAADILRWAGSGAGDAGRGARRGIYSDQALECYVVLPVVAEVVDVDEGLVWRATEVAKPNRGLVECASVTLELRLTELLGITVAQPADHVLVEMTVPPAERRLDDPVQLAEMKAPGDHELAPDRGLDLEQGDAELHSGWFFPGHAAIMTGFAGRRQPSLRTTDGHQMAQLPEFMPAESSS